MYMIQLQILNDAILFTIFDKLHTMVKKFSSNIYNVKKTALFVFSVPASLIIGIFIIDKFNNIPRDTIAIIFFILIVSVIIGFSVFINKIKDLFTNNIDVILNEEFIKITEYNQSGDEVKKECEFSWWEIDSYRYVFKDDITFIFLNINNGRKYNFAFRENIDEGESANDRGDLLNVFLSFVKKYNSRSTDHSIVPCMGFLNTKSGTLVLWGLCIFLVSTFIIHLILKPNSSFISLIVAAIIILSLIVSKKNDRDNYNMMIGVD